MGALSVPRSGLLIAGIAALVAWPFVFSTPFDLRMYGLAGIFAIMVLGYQFIFGHAGALALSQGAFFGLGAYATGLMAVNWGAEFAVTFPASILLAVAVAALVALPVLRLSSHYFALATLGIGQVIALIAIEWVSLTGGANGLAGVPLPAIFGFTIGRGWPLLILIWGLVAVGALLSWQLMRGLYGTACHVMRDDETVARSLGIDIDRMRCEMLLLSAAYGGAAGALYAHAIRIASPEALEFKTMLACLTMAVVGGRTRIAGAILGAILIVHLPEWFRFFDRAYLIFNSVILIALLAVAPEGIAGLIARLLPRSPQGHAEAIESVRGEGGTLPERSGLLLPSATPILEARNVVKTFGGLRALDDISIKLHRGTITAVIGPNGSGKTTLVNCITGIEVPDSGRILLAGADITGIRPHDVSSRGIARTFQNLRLINDLSILDNVAAARFRHENVTLGASLAKGVRDKAQARAYAYAQHLLHRLGVEDVGRMCGSLPYGVKRRVEIARALALDPMLILLDEPAAGLNASEQSDLAGRLQDLAADGTTLLIVEHNMPFLRSLATYMICIDQGRLLAQGRPREIYENPLVIEAYLGVKSVPLAAE
jgi:ABC-type branched-subunit amino acid transport system ATPase component/ABC-type branched-subunit amino acid transport system permease subunit